MVHAEHRGIYLGLPDQATGGVHEYGFCSYAPQEDCMIRELALCSSTMLVKFAKTSSLAAVWARGDQALAKLLTTHQENKPSSIIKLEAFH